MRVSSADLPVRPWRLERGDAFALLHLEPEGSVDCVITDPPYSSGGLHTSARIRSPNKKYANSGSTALHPEFPGDNRDQRSYLAWCTLWLSECLRVLRDGCPIGVFSDWRQLPVTTDALQAAGFVWRGIVPWDKAAARPQRGRFTAQCEFVVWGSKGSMPAERGVPSLPGAYRYSVDHRQKKHLCAKPVPLMRDLVRVCVPGGTVLDPFAGSGSTGVGALLEGRSFVGFEASEYYATVARAELTATAGGEPS